MSSHQKALLGTIVGVIFLALFAGFGYWYGMQKDDDANTNPTTNTQTTDTSENNAATATTLTGKITKVEGTTITIQTGQTEAVSTVLATISGATAIRKLDYSKSSKNGIGDGVAINVGDLKVGANVIIYASDVGAQPIAASKVSMLIFP